MRTRLDSRLLIAFLIGSAMIGACRATLKPDTANVAATDTTRMVTDDLGRDVKIPRKINRAVSLAPNLTESIFAIGGGDRLVGVTTFCDFPVETSSIAKVGDTMSPNIETILALKPDVVFVSTASQIEAFTNTLNDNGIAVYVTNPNTIKDVIDNLKELGDLFGTNEIAIELTDRLHQRISRVSNMIAGEPAPRVFVQISREPLFTIGKQSFLTKLLESAGAVSTTREVETAYPKLSKETALAMEPDVIILSESEDNMEPNEAFRNSPAVKSGRVFRINADILSRPGPRLVDALEQIAKNLYPKKFQ